MELIVTPHTTIGVRAGQPVRYYWPDRLGTSWDQLCSIGSESTADNNSGIGAQAAPSSSQGHDARAVIQTLPASTASPRLIASRLVRTSNDTPGFRLKPECVGPTGSARETLVANCRDCIPSFSELRSSVGPGHWSGPNQVPVAGMASDTSTCAGTVRVDGTRVRGPLTAQAPVGPQPAARDAPKPAHGPGPDGSRCRRPVAEYGP
jgi:hypothetical protein